MSESQFSQLILKAHYTILGNYLISNLFRIRDNLTDNLEIIYTDNVELLETTVRTLVNVDILFPFLNGEITIVNCPQEEVDFCSWFVRFFAYLESSNEDYGKKRKYKINENHLEVLDSDYFPKDIDKRKLKFCYKKILVKVKTDEFGKI